MHVVHVTPYYAPAYAFGGVARAVEGLARAQVARGDRVTVLTTDAHTQTTRYNGPLDAERDGVRVVRARNASVWLRGRANLSTPWQLRAWASDVFPAADVIHCHEFRTTENLLLTPLAARYGVPLVLSPHGTLPHGTGRSWLKQGWDALLSPAVARRFAAVVGLTDDETEDARRLWAQLGAESEFFSVSNGVNADEFAVLPDAGPLRARFGLEGARVVLFMGRLHPRKGVGVLGRAVSQLDAPDVRLLVAGPDEGAGADLRQLAAADPRIVLAGYLDGEARLQALAAADVFALPAVGEGLPMSVLEALAAGVPAVISPECHLPQVAKAGAGRVVPVDADAVAGALADVLADDDLRGRMGAAAQALIAARFTWQAVAAQMADVYAVGVYETSL